MAPYPSKDKIEEIFSDRDIPEIFNTYLSDHVDVSIAGQEFHMAGQHKSKDACHQATFARVAAVLKMETARVKVHQVIGGGESAWAAVHTVGTAMTKSDKPYRNEYVDLVRFNSDGKIAELKEFFDTKELHGHLEEHESAESTEEEKSAS